MDNCPNLDICPSHGQVSMLWTIIHTMDNCPYHGQLSMPWTTGHSNTISMDNCPWYGQWSMTWTIAIQFSILLEMSIVKRIVHSTDRAKWSMTICPFALHVVSDQTCPQDLDLFFKH